jgi:heme/copper-type cytochrome/quinol oxidase subunit 2
MIKNTKDVFLTIVLFMYSLLSGAQKPTLLPDATDQTTEPQNYTLVYILVIIVVATVVLIAWRTSVNKRNKNIRNQR